MSAVSPRVGASAPLCDKNLRMKHLKGVRTKCGDPHPYDSTVVVVVAAAAVVVAVAVVVIVVVVVVVVVVV